MTNRECLRCTTCGEEMTVRTAIGHGDYQEFALPCPKCGIEIRYGMTLDQEKVGIEYTKIVNAEWLGELKSCEHVFTHDGETLVPNELPDHVTAFIATSLLPKDVELFHKHRQVRIHLCRKIWPAICRSRVHLEKENWPAFELEMNQCTEKFKLSNPLANRYQFFDLVDRFGINFRPFHTSSRNSLVDRIEEAEKANPAKCLELREYMHALGWATDLEKEYWSLKDKWIAMYFIVQPIYLSLYWDPQSNSLDDYHLSQKRFDDLRPYYASMFETLARISVVAAGIEGIIGLGSLDLQAKKRLIPLDEYRKMDNGQKLQHIVSLPIETVFSELDNNRLRNGISHHSAHYEVSSDKILFRNDAKSGTTRDEISYSRFCEKLVNLYMQFDTAAIYIQWLCAFDLDVVRQSVNNPQRP